MAPRSRCCVIFTALDRLSAQHRHYAGAGITVIDSRYS
jgi:hypothetical protein